MTLESLVNDGNSNLRSYFSFILFTCRRQIFGNTPSLPIHPQQFGAPFSKHEIIANWGFTLQNFIYLNFAQICAADFFPKLNMAYFCRATNWDLGGTRWSIFYIYMLVKSFTETNFCRLEKNHLNWYKVLIGNLYIQTLDHI